MFCKKFYGKIHQVNKKTVNKPNLPSKIYLCYINTLLNKLLTFANIECKQLQIRGINPKNMNKELFAKVKDKCKDMGLSEKCLTAITEAMGGSVADDSTDADTIESTANLIVSVATASQSEATRWVNKAKGTPKPNPNPNKKDGEDTDPNKPDKKDDGKGGGGSSEESETAKKLQEMQAQLDALKAEKNKGERKATINAAFDKHNIPAFLRDRFAKSISDDEDVEEAVSAFKQDCITNGLMSDKAEGAKAASEKQVDEAADALLESITAK